MTERAVLELRDLRVVYSNGQCALAGVDLDLRAGECVALVGESGCGKTTLARAVLGLLPPSAAVTGSIRLGNEQLVGRTPRAMRELLGRHLGYVAQDPYAACDPLRTVGHHVAESWRAKGQPPPDGVIAATLESLGVHAAAARLRDHPHQWSGGMLQRATIAAATAHGPALTIADEPTSALDADLAEGVLRALRAASRTLLLISHDIRLVAAHADRIAVIHGGRVVEVGPTRRLLGAPEHPYTRILAAAAAAVHAPAPPTATPVTGSVVIDARKLDRSYRGRHGTVSAVREVSLSIHRGEIVGLVGPSGSGKSTLLRLLAGIEAADAGSIAYTDTGRPTPPAGYVMPIFQDPVASLDRRWPLWRTITEPLTRGNRISRRDRRERAQAALADVDLAEVGLDRLPGQLSVGQCQRVAIARALIAEPGLIVADEPTASLDVTSAAGIVGLLERIADRGTAMVVVSHDFALLTSFADRVLRIDHGRLAEPVAVR
jgi:peptide/nickel transport system ATP-binding protein